MSYFFHPLTYDWGLNFMGILTSGHLDFRSTRLTCAASPRFQTAHDTKKRHIPCDASRHRPFRALIGPWLSTAIMPASPPCVCTRDSPDGRHGDHALGAGWMDFSRSLDLLHLHGTNHALPEATEAIRALTQRA